MGIARRGALALLPGAALAAGSRRAAPAVTPAGTVRVGTLQYGTVMWELDVIRHRGLDAKEGFALEVRPFGGNDAADVALMGGAVDAIVEDWLFVSRQRADGAALTFVPYSSNVGAVMVRGDDPAAGLEDLKGRKLGVAGGALDKSWVILRAYAQARHGGLDLARDARPVYAAPPLLNEKLAGGELDAALNYWHWCARLEARGHRRLLGIGEAMAGLGVPATTPQLGYVFREAWAEPNAELVAAFARASRAAKAVLAADDGEWDRLRPLTRAEDDATFAAFRERYREGIVGSWGEAERADAARLFAALAELGGERLVGKGTGLAPGTFWAGVTF